MDFRPLGQNGPSVSPIGFGAWPVGGGMGRVDPDIAVATVRAAIDGGLTLVDTAEGYRDSERVVGEALRDGYRDRCFLATKVSLTFTPAAITAALENSLRALRTDVVDLYQVHRWQPEFPIDQTMETLQRLREQGKVRFVGVSNFTGPQLREAASYGPVHSNQLVYNMFQRTDSEDIDFPECVRLGTGVLGHSTLAKGLLVGKYTRSQTFSATDDERFGFPQFQGDAFAGYVDAAQSLNAIAADAGLTLLQLALAWALRQPVVASVLVGAKTPNQIEDYLPAADVSLEDETLARIQAIVSPVPEIKSRTRVE